MKKALTIAALSLACISAFAQVSITSSNYYTPGNAIRDIYTVENDGEDSVAVANIVTNPFVLGNSLEQMFGVYGIIDTAVYEAPVTEGAFTDETCSFANKDGMRMHINVNDTKAVCIGVSGAIAQLGITDEIDIAFDEPMDVISFPATLNSQTNSTAHGIYNEHISSLQQSFSGMGEYGTAIYQMLIAEYDSIIIDINVTFSSIFDETGNMTLSGNRMMQGTYEYLRENRQHSYVTNLSLHRINGTEYTDINECTLTITDFMMAYILGSSINIGQAMAQYMGISFPMTSTSTTLNYWIANDNYPIVEMTVNPGMTHSKYLAIRYGENEVCAESQTISANIYPNPTSDILNIEIEEMTNGTIRIYSVNGSLVKEEKVNGPHNNINVSTLRNGNYLFNISYGNKEINGNFVKN